MAQQGAKLNWTGRNINIRLAAQKGLVDIVINDQNPDFDKIYFTDPRTLEMVDGEIEKGITVDDIMRRQDIALYTADDGRLKVKARKMNAARHLMNVAAMLMADDPE